MRLVAGVMLEPTGTEEMVLVASLVSDGLRYEYEKMDLQL